MRHAAFALSFATALLLLALAPRAGAEVTVKTDKLSVRVSTVATGLQNPWGVAFLPDGRYLVTEKPGRMRVVSAKGEVGKPLDGLPEIEAAGQGGLLDVALHPDFARNGQIYFSYTEPGGGGNGTAVARAKLESGRLADVQVVFRQSPKLPGRHHYGSRLVFAKDGTLFVTLGERYARKNDAQTLDNHMGKVVRITADGKVPPDNPFVARAGALPEIWSIGHRNLQGAALHPQTGELWTHEHGPQGGDEINVAQSGKNYGWPVITYGEDYGGGKIGEGSEKAGLEQPLYKWVPSIAPSGMVFYGGERLKEWSGNVLIGSLKFQQLVRLELDGNKVVREERMLKELGERIRDVRQGPDGALYLLTDERNGKLLRVDRGQ
jgi:glucose/arabinose dehydrogenase